MRNKYIIFRSTI